MVGGDKKKVVGRHCRVDLQALIERDAALVGNGLPGLFRCHRRSGAGDLN